MGLCMAGTIQLSMRVVLRAPLLRTCQPYVQWFESYGALPSSRLLYTYRNRGCFDTALLSPECRLEWGHFQMACAIVYERYSI